MKEPRLFSVLIALIFCSLSLQVDAQDLFYYSPEGKTYLSISNEKILVKFQDNVSYQEQEMILNKVEGIATLEEDMLLPAPKVTIAPLNNVNGSDQVIDILKSIERHPKVIYANSFLAHTDGTLQGIQDQILVQLKSDKDIPRLSQLLEGFNVKEVRPNEFNSLLFHITVNSNTTNEALHAANLLHESKLFDYAEPDFLRLMKKFNTNDPGVSSQWSLNNDGVNTSSYGGVSGADMKVFSAWATSTGNGIKVAILDEGVDLDHPDLQANMLAGYDATGQGSNGNMSGNDAHGTACAGIVASVANNNTGAAGVSYNAQIIPVRIAYSSGSSWVTSNSWIGNALNWAWQTAGADILSNSWGGGGSSSTINNAIDGAVNNGRGGLGSPVLFAAGNDNGANSYPATYTPTISVIAMSMCNQRKSPSSCDGETWWGSNYGSGADVAAPGVKIYCTDIAGSSGYSSGDFTSTFNGTSSATPNAAGVMALILAANPNLTEAQARYALESNCDKVGGYSYNNNGSQPNGTWSNDLGYGRINAQAAVVSVSGPPTCTDGVQNGSETGVDCGGTCQACPTCSDNIQNGDEEGIDCGGSTCTPCPCLGTEITISITLDNYPEETSWTLTDSNNSTVASGGTYGNLADGSTVTIDVCLDNGCYDFAIFDAYGDGICCGYGNGSYTLSNGNTVLASGGQFTSSETTNFCVNNTPPPCANNGGDADNDGICADVDCNDNDANVGAQQTPGTACNDGDSNTENDVILSDGCSCQGTVIPPCQGNGGDADNDGVCADVDCNDNDANVGAQQTPGTACNDGDANTENDVILSDGCSCQGTVIPPCQGNGGDADNDGICADVDCNDNDANVGAQQTPGTACNDGDSNTENDVILSDGCSCQGTVIPPCQGNGGDADNDGICADVDCNDNDANVGAQQTPGTACNDGDSNTENDVILSDGCSCQGTVIPPCQGNGGDADNDGICADVDCNDNDANVGAQQTPGTACNDGDSNTENDVILSDGCSCQGTVIPPCQGNGGDADNDGICADVDCNDNDANVGAQQTPGTACNDGDSNTENDVILSDGCSCQGTVIPPCQGNGGDTDNDGVCADVDCNDNDANIGAQQTPGTACNDGNANTENDVILADGCTCEGTEPQACTYVTINSNNFESNWGIWNDGGSDARRNSKDANYANGTFCVRLRDNTSTSVMTTDNLDLTGFEELTIDFSYVARSMDNSNEDFWLQISTNGGSSFTTVEEWNRNDEFVNGPRYNESVVVSGVFSSTTKIRFRCDASGNSDWIYIDDVTISGCLNSSSQSAPPIVSSNKTSNSETEETETLKEVEELTMAIYPNPARSILNVVFETNQEETIELIVRNVNGQIVNTKLLRSSLGDNSSTIDLSDYSSGFYYVTIKSGTYQLSKKFMIVK